MALSQQILLFVKSAIFCSINHLQHLTPAAIYVLTYRVGEERHNHPALKTAKEHPMNKRWLGLGLGMILSAGCQVEGDGLVGNTDDFGSEPEGAAAAYVH
jgi:hypothetical protein